MLCFSCYGISSFIVLNNRFKGVGSFDDDLYTGMVKDSCKVLLASCFAPPGSGHRDLFTPSIGVKHPSDNRVHIFPGNCHPAS